MTSPRFKIGFELEGSIRPSMRAEFDAGLGQINPEIDRGTDGSVEARFPLRGASLDTVWGRSDEEHGLGGEIRTPPLPLKQGIALYDEICKYLKVQSKRGNFIANETCGLHVNLSEASMIRSHRRFVKFYAHLIRIFPEKRVLKMFNRTGNSYCMPMWSGRKKWSFSKIVNDLIESEEYGDIEGASSLFSGDMKYWACGLHSWPEDSGGDAGDTSLRRVEFRCLGNENYHLKTDLVHEAFDIILDSATRAFELVKGAPKEVQVQSLRAA